MRGTPCCFCQESAQCKRAGTTHAGHVDDASGGVSTARRGRRGLVVGAALSSCGVGGARVLLRRVAAPPATTSGPSPSLALFLLASPSSVSQLQSPLTKQVSLADSSSPELLPRYPYLCPAARALRPATTSSRHRRLGSPSVIIAQPFLACFQQQSVGVGLVNSSNRSAAPVLSHFSRSPPFFSYHGACEKVTTDLHSWHCHRSGFVVEKMLPQNEARQDSPSESAKHSWPRG